MDWSAFSGAAVGALVATLVIIGGIWALVAVDERRRNKQVKHPTVNNILESQIEEHILANFATLFSGWTIYTEDDAKGNTRLAGAYYHTDAGQIDILCLNQTGNFVVIELKRNKAPDKVIAQVDRYIAWVEKNLAKPNQQVRGLVIANTLDKRLAYSLSRRPKIDFWAYNWVIVFDKNAIEHVLRGEDKASKGRNG